MEFIADGCTVLIDDEDYDKVKDYKWFLMRKRWSENGLHYFTSSKWDPISKTHINYFLHRIIMGCSCGDGKIVDHKNHNTLDCRKENLRICSKLENTRSMRKSKRNTSGYKGIGQNATTHRWIARLQLPDGSKVSMGTYETKEEAARAYDRGALFHYGEFAITNFPRENYTEYDLRHLNQSTGLVPKHNSSGYVDILWNYSGHNWKAVYNDIIIGYYEEPYDAYLAREKYVAELKEKENVSK